MEYLIKTLNTCLEYYKAQGNKEKEKEIKKKLSQLNKKQYIRPVNI